MGAECFSKNGSRSISFSKCLGASAAWEGEAESRRCPDGPDLFAPKVKGILTLALGHALTNPPLVHGSQTVTELDPKARTKRIRQD